MGEIAVLFEDLFEYEDDHILRFKRDIIVGGKQYKIGDTIEYDVQNVSIEESHNLLINKGVLTLKNKPDNFLFTVKEGFEGAGNVLYGTFPKE